MVGLVCVRRLMVSQSEILLGIVRQHRVRFETHRPFHPGCRLHLVNEIRGSTLTVHTATDLLSWCARRMNFLPRGSRRHGRKRLKHLTCGQGMNASSAYDRERPICYCKSRLEGFLRRAEVQGRELRTQARNLHAKFPAVSREERDTYE